MASFVCFYASYFVAKWLWIDVVGRRQLLRQKPGQICSLLVRQRMYGPYKTFAACNMTLTTHCCTCR